MDLNVINSAIEEAYTYALVSPKRVLPQEIFPNVTLQTDVYVSPNGSGFRVICKITNFSEKTITIKIRNYGPDIKSELNWKTFSLLYLK
jgi:hypothetical protein